MNRSNDNSSFNEATSDSEYEPTDHLGDVKLFGLVTISVLLPVVIAVGEIHAKIIGIKNTQDLAINNYQYQQFSICLKDLEQVEQALTASLTKQKLSTGLKCLQKLPISIQDHMMYQNLQSIEQEIVNKDASYVLSQQDKLSSLTKELDLNLLKKTTTGFIANTIIDSFLLILVGTTFFSALVSIHKEFK